MIPGGVDGELVIMLDSPYESKGGKVVGTLRMDASLPQEMTELKADVNLGKVKGKHPIYFIFRSETQGKSLCDLYSFRFRDGR